MLEANLFNSMTALVAARVYPDIAPANTPTPYITYQQVGGKPVNFLGAEYSDKKNARIQINIWSATRIEAATLARSIENSMVAAPLYGLIESGVTSSYEPELKLYGTMQDFSFWS